MKDCLSATSVRRNPHLQYSIDSLERNLETDRPDSKERMHVFELMWPGRTQRFACTAVSERVKWLECIFFVLSKYSHSGNTEVQSAVTDQDSLTIGSATVESLELSPEEDDGGLAQLQNPPRRDLEVVVQETLYSSVRGLLSSSQPSNDAAEANHLLDVSNRSTINWHQRELPDSPRYHLANSCPYSGSGRAASPQLLNRSSSVRSVTEGQMGQNGSDFYEQSPAGAITKNLQRLLTMMKRNDSASMSRSKNFSRHIADMQSQLEGISRLFKQSNAFSKRSEEELSMARKIDELLQ